MRIRDHSHLTYCTNIHPGQSWEEVFSSLEQFALPLKERLAPQRPFGIGLRLSRQASQELGLGDELRAFRSWLRDHDCYVFTMNGFPYGGFHGERVKDKVHDPDWTTRERLDYTLLLFEQLDVLLPEGIEGSISTSPLSYKPWQAGDPAKREAAFLQSTNHILEVIDRLEALHARSGKYLNLSLEPEPDGLIENTDELLAYFRDWLLPMGRTYFSGRMQAEGADALVKRFLTVCYDICHYAVAYEEPSEALRRLREAGVKVGKVQISAALRAVLPADEPSRREVVRSLEPFNESTYLHQVIERKADGSRRQFPDLPEALATAGEPGQREWRCHFHVPLFIEKYGTLDATQQDILKVLALHGRDRFCDHLEVETYTWDVLPADLRLDLTDSIHRELSWVLDHV